MEVSPMGLSINTSVSGLQSARQTKTNSTNMSKILAKLASGRRINRAADDAAGLAIAEGFSTQSRQGRVEINSLQSGINMAQTAEGGLSSQQDATQRLRELSVQASNGILNDSQRQALNAEAQQLVQHINDVSRDTQFNGMNLLDQDQTVDLGTEGGGAVDLASSTAADLGLDTIDLSTAAGAQAAIAATDTAQEQLTTARASIGAQTNRLESAVVQREDSVQNAIESESRIRDLDIARAVVEQSRNDILLKSSISATSQSNVVQQTALQLLGT
jgi:flagellin